MLYLISISISNFIQVEIGNLDTDVKLDNLDEKTPVYKLLQYPRIIKTQLIDGDVTPDYGDLISQIIERINSPAYLLHFNTFIVKYQGEPMELLNVIKSETGTKVKISLAPMSVLHTANFTPQENAFIKWMQDQ